MAVLVAITLAVLLPSSASAQSYSNGMSPLGEIKPADADAKSELEKWREDLEYIKTELPRRHKDLFHRLDKEKFYSEIEKLDKQLPGLTANRAALEFERIVGLARDGHTWTSPVFAENMKFRLFPYALYTFSDGIFVRKASPEYKDIIGSKVLKVGKHTIKEAYEIVAPYMSTDNEMGQMEYVPRYLAIPEVLYALGISEDPDKVVLELEKGGRVFKKEIGLPEGQDNLIRAVRARIKDWPDASDGAERLKPLNLQNVDQMLWYEHVPEKDLLYVRMTSVLNDKEQTLEQFWEKVFAEADAKKPEKLVLDLRYNGGGNNQLVTPIIKGIVKREWLDKEGHFFVVIGRQTFSAAQNLTNMLEKWTNAIFVGEPTASHVNMYGDALSYNLPNSGLLLRISELFWQNMHARDERKWTAPQVVAELSFADYVKNVDPALEAVMQPYKKRPTLREIALAAFRANDLPSFVDKATAFKNDPANKYADVESQINGFGYELIRIKRLDDAVNMFKLNVSLYPDSSNVYDSLGEAYMLKGEKELAIKNYKKSLELDPENNNAKAMIKRIETGHPEH